MEVGSRVLLTGATGQVALPVALSLAREHEVIAIARFRDEQARSRLEEAGVRCISVDLARDDLSAVPPEVDYVCNFAVVKSGRWDLDLHANAEALGLLLHHCRGAKAFLHCSSTGVYEPAGQHPLRETDPLGDNHRAIMETYSISKIAAEVMARYACRQWGVPTTIARLNVPYGDNGGWPAFHLEMVLADQPIPVHPDRPNLFNPIHEDDIARMVPALVRAASVPATIVNWGAPEAVALEEWCSYLGELVGHEARFVETTQTIGGVTVDLTKLHELSAPAAIGWREGLRRMVATRHPEALVD